MRSVARPRRLGHTDSIFPAKTPIQPPRRPSPRTGRITPKNSEVDRRDELEARGEHCASADSGDDDRSVLERLPKRFEHRSGELGELVEKQDPSMGEGCFAGPWSR